MSIVIISLGINCGIFCRLRDGPLFFWRGGMKNPEKNCLQKQKSPNKLFADMKRKNKKFADWLMETYLI